MTKVYHPVPLPLFTTSKICTGCHKEKDITDFYKDNSRKDGYRYRCKACTERHPEQKRVYDHARHAAFKELRSEQHKKRYYANRTHVLARQRAYMKAHPEKAKAKIRHDYESNKLRAHEHYKRRIAIQKGVTVGKVSYQHILERDGYWCHICEQEIKPEHKIHFDHVIPLSRGGSHTEDNIKVAHSFCNIRKHNFLMEELTDFLRRGPD